MNNPSLVSIVLPCRKEQGWIGKCLESVIANDYPKDRLEVLVVDGLSEDGTRAEVEAIAARHPFIHLLDNPKKITPTAMNIGIAAAKGDIIMRMDAHAEYPANYVSALVRWLEESGADNVGGLWITVPGGETPMAQAIALALTHPFGVGNSHYRLGVAKPRWVDTVPFGCYRKEVFQRIGAFDEELVRNQDLELNLRLKKSGGKILLVPDVACVYHARENLAKVWRMSYQNGYYNPLVIRKLQGRMTLRHWIPLLFVVSLFVTGVLAPWSWLMAVAFAAVVLAYAIPALVISCMTAMHKGLKQGLSLALVFPALHVSTGLGTLKGVLDFLILRRNVTIGNKETTVTR
jgi:glycosyltransferase involved in cell wall biosynthesis